MARLISWPALGIAVAVALVGFIGGGIVYQAKRDDWAAADLSEMRAYRVSQMSDEEIRKLRADALAEQENLKRYDKELRAKALQDIGAHQQRCDDLVYRTRNANECSRGIPLGMMYDTTGVTPSVDQLFEESLLGVCRFVKTRQDARINKCLPPAPN
ncbi:MULTISPECIES: hypothetical protein [unclassified Bradyrhizobium]|uniref:hypothetical protein n=1 Tax=Bradyrhizobium sp. 33ap4 TaxID=3061630 RepID=UPI002931C291|nr:hypothetical protein [Bradyrhizobium sp. 33ap4]